MSNDNEAKNLADSLASLLPTAAIVYPPAPAIGDVLQVAIPKTFDLKAIDTECLLAHPRRVKGAAAFADADSFLAYTLRHATPATVAWCDFNPQTFALSFKAVLDDHQMALAGWRGHAASLAPDMSAEWKAWKGKNKSPFAQVAFAEWLEENADDIYSREGDGMPTSLQMLTMATDFKMNEERSLKSAVKLQSGGQRLTFVADADKGTTEEMRMFEKFSIGIPVFHGIKPGLILQSRLKYRVREGVLTFHYELIRPDRAHETAAKELIAKVKDGLGSVPLLMGVCT